MVNPTYFWAYLEFTAAFMLLAVVLSELPNWNRMKKRRTKYLIGVMAALVLMLFSGGMSRVLYGNPGAAWPIRVFLFLTYSGVVLAAVLCSAYMLSYVRNKTGIPRAFTVFVHGIGVAGSVIWLFAIGTDWVIRVNPQTGEFTVEKGFISLILVFAVILAATIAMLVRQRRYLEKKILRSFFIYAAVPLLTMPLALVWNAVPAQLATAAAAVVVYCRVYAEQYRTIAARNKQMASYRNGLAFSQMQPHFVFNTLESIYYLCETDPQTAKTAISDFSAYLRTNIDASEHNMPIPFSAERAHTEKYLSIEKLRFQERLNVVWDIRCDDFLLPVLTLQPLVENAVKHGVNKRRRGGTVTIRTEKRDDEVIVTVSDDGAGFDTNRVKPDDGRSHYGVESVRWRLEEVLGGTLELESTVGVGTVATVTVPYLSAE